MPRAAVSLVSFVFFLSGVSALLFETLWFRQASLTFGNSVWASALVLSSFMAGLALGNGLVARHGHRLRAPIRFYAVLELVVAVTGLGLVWGLPQSTPLFAALLLPLMDVPWLLQPARFAAAFSLLLAPAVAMGATLPALVKALSGSDRDFGRLLGRLYGWNTLGAVAGAASSEVLWIPLLGVLGTGVVAAGGNLIAAALALVLVRRLGETSAAAPPPREPRARLTPRALGLLAASFGCGGILLALEVVWFRILVLFVANTTEAFAGMLAVVLAGIGLGGLLAAAWLRMRPLAHGSIAGLALVSGVVSIAAYTAFPGVRAQLGVTGQVTETSTILALALPLMLPVSLLSGVLFVFLGKRLHDALGSGVRAAGLVTFANTLGAMLGPLAASFVLLPWFGMERSVFLLSASYLGVVLCAFERRAALPWRSRGLAHAAMLAVFLASVARFPFGQMANLYLDMIARNFPEQERLIAVREGTIDTVAILRADWLGEPYYERLVTDNYSMSGNMLIGKRYMELFVHLPAAFHARPKQALLISYGLGTTADAMTHLRGIEHIDVVDISSEILGLSEVIFPPGRNPLDDPRIRVHIEDGRYFLHTTERRYDLITGEPPPPALAGVVNLYTREYFALMRSRLAPGGVVSYWLPVYQMDPREAQAITRAFCAAFPDCSAWAGTATNWILLGSRDATGPLPEDVPGRLWTDPETGDRLRNIGVERPEQLAALFLADAPVLEEWTRGVPPLVDDRPHRAPRLHFWEVRPRAFADLMDPLNARRRFEASEFIARLWPESLRERSAPYFEYERMARESLLGFTSAGSSARPLGELHRVLLETDLEILPLWQLGSDADRQAILDGLGPDELQNREAGWHLGLRALAQRDYELAVERLARVSSATDPRRDVTWLYALCMAGRADDARAEARRLPVAGNRQSHPYDWRFLRATFDVEPTPDLFRPSRSR